MNEEPLWGGRFSDAPDESMRRFADSIVFDIRLLPQDAAATRAHARALERAGILTTSEREEIEDALDGLVREFREGTLEPAAADEDVHSVVERYLTDRLGDTGARIHAGRSRNDLVATDLRMWLIQAATAVLAGIHRLESVVLDLSQRHRETLAPGYTHLQRAQPVFLAHHLLAHGFALARDFDRVAAARQTSDVSPLGAAALSGTSLKLDVHETASELGFSEVFDNAADAVGARDFALEFLAAGAILATSLSRIAEEIVLWSTAEFGFARLADGFSTGSSIMPQKRNPDVGELVRAKAGRVAGNLMSLLVSTKGLPLAYNRDLQEDKEPVFDTADTLTAGLEVLAGTLETLDFDLPRLEQAAGASSGSATDLAEYLVTKRVPFREAHHAVGRLVAVLEEEGRDLSSVTSQDLSQAHPAFDEGALARIDPRASASARASHGGSAPERIEEQLTAFQALLESQRERIGP